MVEILAADDDFEEEPHSVADWFESAIDKTNEQLRAATVIGTLAIAHYQVGRAEIEPVTATLLLRDVDSTDDLPVRRGIYLYDLSTQAVNYLEQRVGSGRPILWLEELSSGAQESQWSGSVFGDVKSPAVNAITGEVLSGQRVDIVELESWNTTLLSSIPVDRKTADLAVKIATRRIAVENRERAPNPEAEQVALKDLDKAIRNAVKDVKKEQRLRGIV